LLYISLEDGSKICSECCNAPKNQKTDPSRIVAYITLDEFKRLLVQAKRMVEWSKIMIQLFSFNTSNDFIIHIKLELKHQMSVIHLMLSIYSFRHQKLFIATSNVFKNMWINCFHNICTANSLKIASMSKASVWRDDGSTLVDQKYTTTDEGNTKDSKWHSFSSKWQRLQISRID
jgi:hypothetical protein